MTDPVQYAARRKHCWPPWWLDSKGNMCYGRNETFFPIEQASSPEALDRLVSHYNIKPWTVPGTGHMLRSAIQDLMEMGNGWDMIKNAHDYRKTHK